MTDLILLIAPVSFVAGLLVGLVMRPRRPSVDRAAQAIWASGGFVNETLWEMEDERTRDHYRRIARRALEEAC